MRTSVRNPVVEEDLRVVFSGGLPWERLSGKTVVVTGAAGLIASYLIEVLLYRNEVVAGAPCTVVALVRDKEAAERRFAHHKSRPDLRFLVQDVAAPMPPDLRTDFVIHAAGNATPRSFGVDPVGTYKAAVLGTHQLLEHAYQAGCEAFLLLSSGAVHGVVAGDDTVITERVMGTVDPLDPYACYAESKRMAETMCASWARQFAVPTRMARLGHTYGPGLRREDDRAFAQFVYAIVDRRDIVLHSDGSAVRAYCYLSDAADALFRILLMGGDGEAYLVAHAAASCSIRELATLLVELFPERGIQFKRASGLAGSVANKDPIRPLNTSKLFSLGWSPQVDIASGFHRTIQSLL